MCFNKQTPIRNGIIKTCFIIATLCIVCLTVLAGKILNSYYSSQNNISYSIEHAPNYYDADSVDIRAKNAINYYGDSTGISVISVDEHRILNTEFNLSEPSGLLDSIVYNLTLAVNSVNNVLTSGSILIAILTLFIALVGIFAYHDLKNDIQEKLDKENVERKTFENSANTNLENEKTERQRFEKNINTTLDTERTYRESFESSINEIIRNIELKIDECCENAQRKMQILERTQIMQDLYFKKSIEFLYMISSNLLEEDDDDTLRNSIYHDLQIMMLYRYEIFQDEQEAATILHQKKAALDYLKDHSLEDDISDLEYVAKCDPNEEIRRKAIEVIGAIKK